MKICTILGTRPEIIKLSPLLPLLDQEFEHILVHTGQHYDHAMDKVFFEELQLRQPKYNLNIGSKSQGKQTGLMLQYIEEILLQEKPDLVIVQGDTNTAPAGSLAAVKLHLPVMHIEAGCRSCNRQMPEEINRIVADHLSTYLIAPDEQSVENLRREGIVKNVFLTGSTAFDAVVRNKQLVSEEKILQQFNLQKNKFIVATIHRAENTDTPKNLRNIVEALEEISQKIPVVFPMHPRTKKALELNNITINLPVQVIEPQSYLSFLALLASCVLCISDSGGIQEEALVFNKPCLIPRKETEWMRLVNAGKNFMVGTEKEKIIFTVNELIFNTQKLESIQKIQYPYPTKVHQKIMEVIAKITP